MLALRVLSVENSANDVISGHILYNIGKTYNMSMLSIIGKAMKNIESDVREVAEEMCRLHRCREWTKWSDCDVSADTQILVGVQTRSQTCGENIAMCERYGIFRTVLDYKVCESGLRCPEEYKLTANGFCSNTSQARNPGITLKPFIDLDGGHLVHVDSELKAIDVHDTLIAQSLTMNFVWIDGRLSVQAGPWSYGYKAIDPNFTYWDDNDPDSKPGELCMVYRKYEKSKYFWRWFDYYCNWPFHFICQILHSC
jgi:hypothetical protein